MNPTSNPWAVSQIGILYFGIYFTVKCICPWFYKTFVALVIWNITFKCFHQATHGIFVQENKKNDFEVEKSCLIRSTLNDYWSQHDKNCIQILPQVSSATETSKKIEISLVASIEMILSTKRITKALISLHRCAGWSAQLLIAPPSPFFLRPGLIYNKTHTKLDSYLTRYNADC